MTSPNEHKLNAFMNEVCSHIKCREVHEEIVYELRGHLDDSVEYYISQGLSQNDAVDEALIDMGSPVDIGRGLHRTHRPQTDWWFLGMVGMYIGVAILTLYSMDGITDQGHDYNSTAFRGLFAREMVWMAIGLAMAVAAAFVDYRRVRHISNHLLWTTGVLMVVAMVFGRHRMGLMAQLSYGRVCLIAPFLLLIALAGIIDRFDLDRRSNVLQLCAMFVMPMWIFIKSSVSASSLVYGIGFLGLMLATPSIRKYWGIVLGAIGLVMVSLCVTFLGSANGSERIQAFLHPQPYAHTYAYEYIQGRQALNTAGFWGHGLHANIPLLPGIRGEMVHNYLIYAFGWVGGLITVALMVTLFARMIWMSRKTSDGYGRRLVITLGIVLGTELIYPVLMALGVVPLLGMYIPLFSTGGSVSIVELTCLGVVLSVYRRRNIVRKLSECTKTLPDVE